VAELVNAAAALDIATPDVHGRDVVRAPPGVQQDLPLLVREHRVVDVELQAAEEVAGGRDLRVGAVVHVHDLEVAFDGSVKS
jgi:hypothetical protein